MKNTTLIIEDEVNVKISGLDLPDRKALVQQLKIMDPAARHTPAFRLGRWDGCTQYFTLGGASYINLLPEILPYLEKRGYTFDVDDRREYIGKRTFNFAPVTADSFAHVKWHTGHRFEGQPLKFEEHQVTALNRYFENPQCIQELSTGFGKTAVTAALSSKVETDIDGRTVVIVPNRDLVTQTEKIYKMFGLDVGVFFGGRKEYNKKHTICTWQSLMNLIKETKKGDAEFTIHEFLDNVLGVIVDECFSGDTLVTTPQGNTPIKDLKAGDKVINLCEKTKQYKEDTVVKVHQNLTNSNSEKMLELEFDNGVKIQVTANHKFLTNEGWIRADELTDEVDIIDINTYS